MNGHGMTYLKNMLESCAIQTSLWCCQGYPKQRPGKVDQNCTLGDAACRSKS